MSRAAAGPERAYKAVTGDPARFHLACVPCNRERAGSARCIASAVIARDAGRWHTENNMAYYTDNQTTRIRPGGLRYECKTGGSSFIGTASSSISCLLCGHHRPRAQLRSFRLAGALQYRCKDGC